MSSHIVFNANDFMMGVQTVKKFWLQTKLNRLRIEAHKDTKTAEFISINKVTGLETGFSIPVHVMEDVVIYVKTVGRFYEAVDLLQAINTDSNGSLKLVLEPSYEKKNQFILRVLLDSQTFYASYEPIP